MILTNLTNQRIAFIGASHLSYEILPGKPLDIPDHEVPSNHIDSLVVRGIITATNRAASSGNLSNSEFQVTFGSKDDTPAGWWSNVTGHIGLLKLLIAATVGAGSHVYGYIGNNLSTDDWTLMGSTRRKTYTYNGNNQLISETDWV